MSDSSMDTRMDMSSRDALTTLWYFFTSSRWAALLLAVLALTAVLSMVGPHLDTSGAVTMSQGATPTRMGALTVQEPVLSGDSVRFLGGLWLRVLLAIFAFTLLLRLVDRFALAFGARHDLTRMQSTYLPGPASYDGRASSEWTEDEIRKHVSTWPGARLIRGWSVAEEKKTIFCVENVRFTMWGDWLLHLGFLVIIVGLFVSAQWGWREDDIALAAGETYELDYASGYTLDFEPAPDADEPGRSTLSLAHGGVEGKAFAVSALKPHIAAPLSLFQVSTGPALTLSATEVTGESLWLQPLTKGSNASSRVTLKFAEGQEESYLFVPDAGVTLRIVRYQALPEEGFEQPVYLLRGYRGTQSSPLFSEYVTEDTTFEWQTLTFSAAVTDYLALNAVSDWGWWIVVAGSLLLLIGAAMNRGPSPWVVCFQTERLEAEPLVFEQVTLWSRNGVTDHSLAFARVVCDDGGSLER